jgi:hypothetical protein
VNPIRAEQEDAVDREAADREGIDGLRILMDDFRRW